MDLKKAIREIENFPKEGINFKDITTLMQDGETFKYTIDAFINELKDKNVDVIVGPEARGFLMGTPVAYGLGVGFVPVRKPGKLPSETISYSYGLNTHRCNKTRTKSSYSSCFISYRRNYGSCSKTNRTIRWRSGFYAILNRIRRPKRKREIISIRSKFFNKVLVL